jgi:hypothetical protein
MENALRCGGRRAEGIGAPRVLLSLGLAVALAPDAAVVHIV